MGSGPSEVSMQGESDTEAHRHTAGEGHATTEAGMSESPPSQAVPRFTVTVGSWETVVEEGDCVPESPEGTNCTNTLISDV